MIFNLKKMLPKERRELDDEKRKKYADHYAAVLNKYGYNRDDDNAASFDILADYFGRWYAAENGECDFPEKGLFIYGDKGTGKTTSMQMFSGLFGIDIVPIEDFTIAFTRGREDGFWTVADEYKYKRLIIDDVCNEREAKIFGNSIPLPEFFKQREAMWRYDGVHTFFTSNAKGREEITKLYGDMIMSRFLGSCEFIKLGGKDRRIFKK